MSPTALPPRPRAAAIASLTLALAALGLAGAAHAQPAAGAPPDTTRPVMFLKETVVTGARYPRAYYESPQALSFVSRLQLREQLPAAVGDVLSALPGVDNSKDSPWEQRPVLRGLSGQRVLVLMDGSPMNSARGNGPHPSLVDPSQVERIEVVRGPSSVSYGSDAIGGVINIITRESPYSESGRSLGGGVTLGGSSAERLRSAQVELMPSAGRFSAFLSGGARRAEDFEAPDRTVGNSAFEDYNALANLRYDFTERLALKGGWQQYRGRDIGIPGLDLELPGATQHFQFSFYDRDFAHLTLDHRYPASAWMDRTRIQIYRQREHRDFYSEETLDRSQFTAFGIPPGGPGSAPANAQTRQTNQDRYFDLETWGFQTQLTSARTKHTRFAFGVDAARDRTDGDNVRFRSYADASGAPIGSTSVRVTASVPDGTFDNYAGFLQGDFYVHPRVTVSAGGRLTHYRYRTEAGLSQPGFDFVEKSLDDDALSGSLGLVYTPYADVHLTANVANGYREPNAQDLFFSGPASVGFVIGNPDLKPEKSLSYDAGLRWGPGGFAFAGNLFYSTFDDLINALPVSPSPPEAQGQPTYEYTNIATATIWGGDLEAEWRFLPQWTARTTMAGQMADITSRDAILKIYGVAADKVALELVPPFKGNASVRWTDSSRRYWVEPSARYSWRTNRLPPPVPGVGQLSSFKKEYVVGDIFAGAAFGAHRLTVGIKNFTNRDYRPALASVEDPGISFVGSLSATF